MIVFEVQCRERVLLCVLYIGLKRFSLDTAYTIIITYTLFSVAAGIRCIRRFSLYVSVAYVGATGRRAVWESPGCQARTLSVMDQTFCPHPGLPCWLVSGHSPGPPARSSLVSALRPIVCETVTNDPLEDQAQVNSALVVFLATCLVNHWPVSGGKPLCFLPVAQVEAGSKKSIRHILS